jgi:hypothetical protein
MPLLRMPQAEDQTGPAKLVGPTLRAAREGLGLTYRQAAKRIGSVTESRLAFLELQQDPWTPEWEPVVQSILAGGPPAKPEKGLIRENDTAVAPSHTPEDQNPVKAKETAATAKPQGPQLTYQRPSLYKEQLDAIYAPARWSLVEATTKAGKTAGCIAWIVEKALLDPPGRNYWWVAPVAPVAAIAYRRTAHALAQDIRVTHDTKQTITLINGNVIWFKSGEDPDNLYGEDVYAAVIDEASRLREASWHAIRTTLSATKGPARIIGNVKGRRNWFYALCRKAEVGEKDMAFHKLTWRHAVKAGILDEAEVEDAKRVLPPAVFRELYEAEPSDDGGNPFGLAAIAKCVSPLSLEPQVVGGGDFGKRTDYSAWVGLDRHGYTAKFDRWVKLPWPETQKKFAGLIGHSAALMDSTGVGDPIVDGLQRICPSVEGYWLSDKAKQALMENLATMIQGQEIHFPDGPIRTELEAFEFTVRVVGGRVTGVSYSAPPGQHDDCVIALALAAWHRKFGGHVGTLKFERNEQAARTTSEWGFGHEERDALVF